MILKDKVAVVTGSSTGIGRGIAHRFAREGAKVVVNGRHADAVQAVVDEIRVAGGTAIGVVADVTDEAQVQRLFDEAVEAFGTVDILVNNAVTHVEGENGPLLKLTSAAWDSLMKLNLGALFYCTHRAAAIMAQQRRGSIINISTNGAIRAHRLTIPYDSMKGAMDAFTRAVAVDLAPWGIRVNAIRPGLIATTSFGRLSEEEKARRRAAIPLGREGFPEDVAWAVVFLSADDAAYVTGQCLQVDGGLLVQGRAPCAEVGPIAGPDNIDQF